MLIVLSTWCKWGCKLTVASQRGWEGCSRGWEGDAVGTDRDRHTGGDQATGDLYTGLRSLDFILLATNSKNWVFIFHIVCWGWQRKTPTFTRASEEDVAPHRQGQEPWWKESAARLAGLPGDHVKSKPREARGRLCSALLVGRWERCDCPSFADTASR